MDEPSTSTPPTEQAIEGFQELASLEGIIPALESSHAIAHIRHLAREVGGDGLLVVNLSGRGDKDVQTVEQILKESTRVAD